MRIFWLMLITAWPCITYAATPDIENSNPDVQAVLDANAKLEVAVATGDVNAIAGFFAPDFRLQNSANSIVARDAVIAQFASGQTRFNSYERKVEAAYSSNGVVVLMGEEKVQPRSTTNAMTFTRRFTSVWQNIGGKWQQIARQSTNVAPK